MFQFFLQKPTTTNPCATQKFGWDMDMWNLYVYEYCENMVEKQTKMFNVRTVSCVTLILN
jgi:hypothetical protein